MNLSPTKEQVAVMASSDNLVKVKAAAGSGKTSTIKLYSDKNVQPSIYLAFNKSIAAEVQGKLGGHVIAKTTHSLAFSQEGKKVRHKLVRPKGGYVNVASTPSEISKYFNLQPIMFGGAVLINTTTLGLLIRNTVNNFQASSDKSLELKHVSGLYRAVLKTLDIEDYEFEYLENNIRDKVLVFAKRLWKKRVDKNSPVLATHDTYLKLYQLSNPKLNYDIIYLDEAQDTTDCVLDIVMSQKGHAKIIMVGDDFQAIYSWRGAINAMSKISSDGYQLTKSFRFGNEIAKVARAIIKNKLPIVGNEDIKSVVGLNVVDTSKKYTKIYRTNGGLLEDAIKFISEGLKVSAEVNAKDFIKVLESAEALFQGDLKKVKHDLVMPYKNWYELTQDSKVVPELGRVCKIIENREAIVYINCIKQLQKRDDADIILTTAHKSKGREWDQVVLANDFKTNEEVVLSQEEINLLYVAATRAIKRLNINQAVSSLINY